MKGKRIAVLGGGPMGLAVAYQLALQGAQPIIYEADNRLGGMTASFDFSGMMIERYYHFHCTSDNAFLSMLNELGLSQKVHWVETKMGYWFKNKLQPWGNPVALLKFDGLSFIAKLRYGLHAFLSTKRNDWQPLDHKDAISWIKEWVGKEAYEVLWRRLFDYKFYNYKSHLSAAWIWSRIRRIGRSRYNLMKEQLGYLEGGSQTLLNALSKSIKEHGGIICLNSRVSKVIIRKGEIKGLMIDKKEIKFDTVISTIPLPFIPKLIPNLPKDILTSFKTKKNIAVACVILKLKKRFTENFWLNVNDASMDIPGIVEYTNLRPMKHHIVYVPFYMPKEHPKFLESDDVFITKVKRYMTRINPSLAEKDFIEARVSRYRYAQPICEPNYLDHLPPTKLPIKGLWVADTSYYYPEDRGISESIGFGRQLARDMMIS